MKNNRLTVVVRQLQSIIADLVSEVKEIARKLDRALHQNSTKNDADEKEIQLIEKLPLNSLKEFDQLEEKLKEIKFHKLLVSCN
jgi:predicted RNase H-like nuclease (RuvC/YqgF family)